MPETPNATLLKFKTGKKFKATMPYLKTKSNEKTSTANFYIWTIDNL